jgi:hypothetical protein
MKISLQIAAALQFSILIASALVPRVLDWRRNLAGLHPFLRRLFWVYGTFIVLIIVGFAVLTLLHARSIAAGDPMARSISAFIAFFWLVRLVVQIAVFDPRAFLKTWFYKAGYRVLTVIFALLVLIYGWAAIGPNQSFL